MAVFLNKREFIRISKKIMKYCWVKLNIRYMFGVYVGLMAEKFNTDALIF